MLLKISQNLKIGIEVIIVIKAANKILKTTGKGEEAVVEVGVVTEIVIEVTEIVIVVTEIVTEIEIVVVDVKTQRFRSHNPSTNFQATEICVLSEKNHMPLPVIVESNLNYLSSMNLYQ